MMVNRKTADARLAAWREGLELEDALQLFSPHVDQSKLAAKIEDQRQIAEMGKRNFRMAGAPSVAPVIDAIAALLSPLPEAVEARESRQSQLIEALERGQWLALGFPADRPEATEPEPVPQFLIQKQFAKWRKSEFSDGQTRYAKVRIIPAGALAKPKTGRPSNRDRVLEIAAALVRNRTITKATPRKVQIWEIRKLGAQRFPNLFSDENVPSDQTIKRHLVVFWNSGIATE